MNSELKAFWGDSLTIHHHLGPVPSKGGKVEIFFFSQKHPRLGKTSSINFNIYKPP